MSFYTRKDNQTYREGQMPLHYPADRVYLDGDVNKSVQDAVERSSVRVTADGVKTRAQLLDALHALMDSSKITNDSKIAISSDIHTLCSKSGSTMRFFSNISMDSTQSTTSHILFRSSGSENLRCICNNSSTNTINDISSTILTSGTKITLYY